MIYILYISTALHFFLALAILISSYRNRASIYFSGFLVGSALWSLSNAFFSEAPNEDSLLIWAYAAYTIATFMLGFLYFFSNSISSFRNNKTTVNFSIFIIIASFILPYIPDLIITGVNFENRTIEGTNFLPLLFITYFYLIFISIRNLYIGTSQSLGIKKVQLRFIFIGLLTAIIVGVTTNIVLPTFNNYSFVTIGPSFTIVFLSFAALSIFRYEFLNIRIVVGTTIKNTMLMLILLGSYYFALFLNIQLFNDYLTIPGLLLGLPLSIIVIFVFNISNNFLNSYVKSKFISPNYDLNTEVKKFNRRIATKLRNEDISKVVFEEVDKTLSPKEKTIIIFHNDTKPTVLGDINLESQIYEEIRDTLNKINTNIIIADKVEIEIDNMRTFYRTEYSYMLNILRENQIEVVISLDFSEKQQGLILLGRKSTNESYTLIDIEFLEIIEDTIGLSIQRANLYREVQAFNETLQHKIDDATNELKKKNKALAEALRKERDMLDILGHELRTPLGTARNAIMMLNMIRKSEAIEDEKSEHYLKIATENIVREVKILETILSSARIENDRLDLTFEKVDGNDVISDSYESYSSQAQKKGLTITLEKPSETLFCYADRSAIQQVMDNLVSNAIKYTEEGSVTLKVENGGDMINFSVIDTGEGIPEKEKKNLGKKFYRIKPYLESSGKIGERQIVRPGGTGIGLFVVFNLLKNMEGKLDIQSEVGKGSTFTFSIPKFTGQKKKEIKNSDKPRPSIQKKMEELDHSIIAS